MSNALWYAAACDARDFRVRLFRKRAAQVLQRQRFAKSPDPVYEQI
jgi:hypothetical protein